MKYVRIDWCVYVINVKLVHIRQHFNSDCVVIIFIKRDNCFFLIHGENIKQRLKSFPWKLKCTHPCRVVQPLAWFQGYVNIHQSDVLLPGVL